MNTRWMTSERSLIKRLEERVERQNRELNKIVLRKLVYDTSLCMICYHSSDCCLTDKFVCACMYFKDVNEANND